jgi:hypothetical protein
LLELSMYIFGIRFFAQITWNFRFYKAKEISYAKIRSMEAKIKQVKTNVPRSKEIKVPMTGDTYSHSYLHILIAAPVLFLQNSLLSAQEVLEVGVLGDRMLLDRSNVAAGRVNRSLSVHERAGKVLAEAEATSRS